MIVAHIADLHFGKSINGFSLIDDQKHIIDEILKEIALSDVEALIVAGDIYDKSIPSIDAVNLFDFFINELIKRKVLVFIISGNHDNSDRLSFASDILSKHHVHIITKYKGAIDFVEVGDVRFYMLPFVKPADVRKFFDDDISSYDEAVRKIVDREVLDKSKKNILIAHQFVTSSGEAAISDSEIFQVGTLDNIDAGVFIKFDYTALGHLHRPQCVGAEKICYSGSILKYSFSENRDNKRMIILDTTTMNKRNIYLKPKRDMVVLEGMLEEVLRGEKTEDYYKIILTDKYKGIDVFSKLRKMYPNIMKLEYKILETEEVKAERSRREKNPLELLQVFYRMQKGHAIEKKNLEVLKKELGDIT